MAFDPEFPNDKAVREAVERANEVRALRMAAGKAAAAQPQPPGPFIDPSRVGPQMRADPRFAPRLPVASIRNVDVQPAPFDRAVPFDARITKSLVSPRGTSTATATATPTVPFDRAMPFDARITKSLVAPREAPTAAAAPAAAPAARGRGFLGTIEDAAKSARGLARQFAEQADGIPEGVGYARDQEGRTMYSGEGTPVYRGRAKFGGVDQPVFTDSPYDPLLRGKSGKEAAKFFAENPGIAAKHAAALAPGQERMKRRADAVAAAGPQYSLAELGTVANAQKTLAEAEKIKSATSIAADANSRLNREASLKAQADNDAMLKSIMDSGQAATPEEALMIALQSPNFAPAVSSAVEAADRRSREALRGAFDSGWNIWENDVGGNVIPGYEGSIPSGLSPDQINYEDFELSEAPGISRFWDYVTPDFQGIGGTHSLKWKGPVEEGMTQPTSMLNASEAKEVQRWLEMQRLLRSRKNTGG